MPLDHIDLHRREIGITVFCVLQRFFRMREAVEFMLDVFLAPIVKIIIVKQCAAQKIVEINARAMALVMPIAEISNLDGMGISTRFHVMAKSLHFLKFVRVDDALHQMIKFGIDLHKNTFRVYSFVLVCVESGRIIPKKTATTEVIAAMKRRKTDNAYLIFTENILPHFGHLQLCSPLIFFRRICTLQCGHLR